MVDLITVEQLAVVPPFSPTQLQVHGPLPEIIEALPELHSPEVGAEE
jgi:hypothetical protein